MQNMYEHIHQEVGKGITFISFKMLLASQCLCEETQTLFTDLMADIVYVTSILCR